MIERLRFLAGSLIVKLGMHVIGFDAGKLGDVESDDEDDSDLDHPSTFQVVELNDRARAMVQEGIEAQSPTRRQPVQTPGVLAGSARARIEEERRKARNAMRSRG